MKQNLIIGLAAIIVVIILVVAGVLFIDFGNETESRYVPKVGDFVEWNTQYRPSSSIPSIFNHTMRWTITNVTETNLSIEVSIWYPETLTEEMIALNQRPLPDVHNESFSIAYLSWLNVSFDMPLLASRWGGMDVYYQGVQNVSTKWGVLNCEHYHLMTDIPINGSPILMIEMWSYHAVLIEMRSSYYTMNYFLVDTNIALIANP